MFSKKTEVKEHTALWKVLDKLGACDEALDFVDDQTPLQAWNRCTDVDWLLWTVTALLTPAQQERAILDAYLYELSIVAEGDAEPTLWPKGLARWQEIDLYLLNPTMNPLPAMTPKSFWEEKPHFLLRGLELAATVLNARAKGLDLPNVWPGWPDDTACVTVRRCVKFDELLAGLKQREATGTAATRGLVA